MTLEEKLANFKKCAINDANMQSQALISDSEENIKNSLEEYEARAKEEYENKLKIQSSIIVNKNNQDITKESLKIKQKVEKRRLELVDGLFEELEKMLREFKKKEEYKELLIKQINKVKDFSKDSKFTVYIDRTDSDLLEELTNSTKTYVEISKVNMLGGIRAIIEEKNLLVDYSFASKMHEEKVNFTF